MLVKVISKIESDSNNAVDMQLKRYLAIPTNPGIQELGIKLHKELEEYIQSEKYDPMQMSTYNIEESDDA